MPASLTTPAVAKNSPYTRLAAIAAVLTIAAVPSAGAATTDTATAAVSAGPYTVGALITFTSTTPCSVPCRLIWKYLNGTRLGDQLGEGQSVQTSFATTGLHTVQLELNRAIYMDERRRERSPRFAQVAADFTALANALAQVPLGDLGPFQAAAE